MIKIVPFIYNNDFDELLSNTYVLIDDAKNCVVVDPSKDNENIKDYIKKNKLKPKAVLLTHGHFDHFKGAHILTEGFKIPLYIHAEDEEMIRNSSINCSNFAMSASMVSYSFCSLYENFSFCSFFFNIFF